MAVESTPTRFLLDGSLVPECRLVIESGFVRISFLETTPMAFFKLLLGPLRRIASFPLVQFAVVILAILWLQAADNGSPLGEIYSSLDWLVNLTIQQCSSIFEVKSFTRAWLVAGFMIAYVYLAGLVIVFAAKLLVRALLELMARMNLFGLTNVIARERGIAAYRAWLPFERIRPSHIPLEKWEEMYAWPADNTPPYPPLTYRVLRGIVTYVAMAVIVIVLLQVFTPIPAAAWLGKVIGISYPW